MAADKTLVEGAYRASRHYDAGKSKAQKDLGDTIASTVDRLRKEKDKGKETEESSTTPSKSKSKKSTGGGTDEQRQQAGSGGGLSGQESQSQLDSLAEYGYGTTEETNNENEEARAIEEEILDPNAAVESEADANAIEGVTPNNEQTRRNDLEEQKLVVDETIANNGDKGVLEEVNNNLDTERENQDILDEAFAGIGNNWTNRSQDGGVQTSHGYGMSLERSPEKDWIMEKLNNPEKTITRDKLNADGVKIGVETGVVGPDGEFMTAKQFESHLEKFEVDNKSFNAITSLAQEAKEVGTNSGPTGMFDYDAAKASITNVVDGGNMSSLIHDPSFGGRSFADDLKEGDLLQGKTYHNLGLDASMFDKDGDGKISENDELTKEDKDSIIDAYLNSDFKFHKKERREYLINYYTDHLQKNHQFGLSGTQAKHNKTSGSINEVDGKKVWTP